MLMGWRGLGSLDTRGGKASVSPALPEGLRARSGRGSVTTSVAPLRGARDRELTAEDPQSRLHVVKASRSRSNRSGGARLHRRKP